MTMTIYLRKYIALLLTGVLAGVLTACEHKDLCYDHGHVVSVQVNFDWQKAPDADPRGMNIWFFPEEGGEPLRFGFNGREGGVARIPAGNYRALCINTDSDVLLYRNTNTWDGFEVYTRDASLLEGLGLMTTTSKAPAAEGAEDERVVLPPDLNWTARLENITIEYADPDASITFVPEQVVCTYDVEVRNVQNLATVSAVSGALSGMAGSWFVGTHTPGADVCTLPFEAQSDKASTITARFYNFGHQPTSHDDKAHKLTVYVVQGDGQQVYYTFDVTDQVHNAPDPRHVTIVVEGLELPEPIVSGSGLNPSVDGWENVNVDVVM